MAWEPHIRGRARFSEESIGPAGLTRIGNAFVASQDVRLGNGLDVYDQPAKPLRPRYAATKVARGLKAIRDWFFRGRTRRSIKVTSVSPGLVIIAATDSTVDSIIHIRNQDVRQFGVSPHDRHVIVEAFLVERRAGRAEKVA